LAPTVGILGQDLPNYSGVGQEVCILIVLLVVYVTHRSISGLRGVGASSVIPLEKFSEDLFGNVCVHIWGWGKFS
jgi:hypothetical protein